MLKFTVVAALLSANLFAEAKTHTFDFTEQAVPSPDTLRSQSIPVEISSLYSETKIDKATLTALTPDESVLIKLPDTILKGKVIKTSSGNLGSKHIVIRSYIDGIPVSSIITIGEKGVYMELITDKGAYSASGVEGALLFYKQKEVNQRTGISFDHDFIDSIPYIDDIPNRQQLFYNELHENITTHQTGGEGAPLDESLKPLGAKQASKYHASDNGSDIVTIDMLIVYSQNCEEVVDDVNAKIDHFIAYTNEAFEASGILAKVQVKGIQAVEYPYSDGGDGLDDITEGVAPFEDIARLRVEVGADAVALLTPQNEGDSSAGVAWKPAHLKRTSYGSMYSQTDINYSGSVFAHELGHNLGLGHSRAQGEEGGDFPSGVGYRIPIPNNIGFATIMAYETRDAYEVPFFSNPSNLCGELPCGLPREDENFGADAVHAVNAVRHVVANYSETKSSTMSIEDALANITDPALKQCISNRVTERTRFANEIRYLSCFDEVYSLEGLENFSSLETLYLNKVVTEDLSRLQQLPNLASLSLFGSNASDFSFLERLGSLQRLDIRGSNFDNTQAQTLASLVNLQSLWLSSETLTTLPDLSALIQLEDLYISADLQSLDSIANNAKLLSLEIRSRSLTLLPNNANWPLLESLDLRSSNIESLEGIHNFPKLTHLDITDNELDSLVGLGSLSELTSLYAGQNNITNIQPVSLLSNLKKLSVSFNPIDDVSPLENLASLEVLNIESISTGNVSMLNNLENIVDFRAGSIGYDSDWSIIRNMKGLTSLSLLGVDSATLKDIENYKKTLSSLYLGEVVSNDLTPFFKFYRLDHFSLYPRFDVELYCWQVDYLKNIPLFGFYTNSSCSAEDDSSDYDGDGISNRDELSANRNPTIDDRVSSTVSFDIDGTSEVSIFEDRDSYESYYTAIIERLGDSSIESTVTVNVTEGDATRGDDFEVDTDLLIFPPGSSFTRLNVTVYDDYKLEGEESFTIKLSEPVNTEILGTSEITIKLLDELDGGDFQEEDGNSGTPSVKWETLYQSANERDGSMDIVVNRPTGLTGPFSVEVTSVPLSENAEGSYELKESLLSFNATDAFLNVTVSVNDDSLETGSKFISLRLENAENTIVDPEYASLTLEIKDDESSDSRIGFQNSLFNVTEDVGTVTLMLIRSAPYNEDVPFSIVHRGFGTATLDLDAQLPSSSFVFPAGLTSFSIDLTIIDDDIFESLENLELELDGIPNSLLSQNDFVSVYIEDNDSEPTGTISFSQPEMEIDESNGSVEVTLVRTGGLEGTRTVTVSPSFGTATDNDFSFEAQEISFQPGEETKRIQVSIEDDTEQESSETFYLTLSSEVEAVVSSPDTIAVTILDNDEEIMPTGKLGFEKLSYSVDEDSGTIEVTVLRTEGLIGELKAEVTLEYGSASSNDVSFTPVTLIFSEGESVKTVSVAVVNDSLEESQESFTLSINAIGDNTQIGEIASVTVYIQANDAPTNSGGNDTPRSNGESGGGSAGAWLILILVASVTRRKKLIR